METSRADRSIQSSMRSHNCQFIQSFIPILPSQSFHTNRTVSIVRISRKVRPSSLPNLRSLFSLVIVGRIGIIVTLAAQVSLVMIGSVLFLFNLGSLRDVVSLVIAYLMPPRRGTLWIGYLPGRVGSGPIELETAVYQLSRVSYRALLAVGFGANSYSARWLPNPQDSPPVGRR